MQAQALDFISAIKYLIQDTVQQQQLISQQMFKPPPNYHVPQPEQQQTDAAAPPREPGQQENMDDLNRAALNHTNMIQTYLKEIEALRTQKDEMLKE